ncbi:MAG: OmpA family protein [Desulfuromonadaceae bacterium]
MRKKMICTLAAALIVSTTAAFGAIEEGSFSVTPLVGGYVFDGGKSLDPTLIVGVRGGYNFTKTFGVEAVYDYAIPTDDKFGPLTDISFHRFGAQALYHFFPDNAFVPYLAAGYSGIKYEGNRIDTTTHGAFDYGIGAKYFLTDNIAVRGDVRHIHYKQNFSTSYYSVPAKYNDLEFTLGAYFQFGGTEPVAKAVEPTPPPEPVKTVAAPAPVPPADSDNDGVIDSLDKCPNTPAGVAVDGSGCPADSDKDGVADYLDKCQGTPAGVAVDGSGCPVDTDKDGVADYLDKCPETPAGAAVDGNGCPVDTDKDGVADYLDKCPETPVGVTVDAKGCPLEAAKRFCDKPAVIAITFDTNKAVVKPEYYKELDTVGNFLKEFPNSKGTIDGHTDSTGSKAANMKLSQKRAENVRGYIIDKFGIDGSRITAKGFGPTKPVASNKSASGKAKNRRIEAVFSCE